MVLQRSFSPAAALAAFAIVFLNVAGARGALADDGIFSAAPIARAAVDFDGRGFLLHGRREFIASGTMHYPRVPRALWRDRLLRIKRAGFNCIETYAFWNLHEPREGKWDFSGDNDLDGYLRLIKELGMYAIVRVGPYVCAEWDSGGYPVWLRFKAGVRVREHNPQFEAAVDRWYEKVIPIVAANQIHHGGAVIMVQLENEHPQGWGKEMPTDYFKHLRDKAVALGVEVPYFFSGLHHGSDPAGNAPWDSKSRTNPWFTTEFWPGWYDLYGPLNEARYRGFVRGTWKILAYGGNGYNYYMLHGGTNFDTWNDDEVASSYDYAAAIGQAGDLRPIYYAFKQAAMFARSFPEILEDSMDATAEFQGATGRDGLRVTARKSPAGEIVFLDNPSGQSIETTNALLSTRPITVAPGEIRAVVRNYPIASDVVLRSCSARILGIARQGDTTTLVIFGTPGKGIGVDRVDTEARPEAEAELAFDAPAGGLLLPGADPGQTAVLKSQPLAAGRARVGVSIPLPDPDDKSPIKAVSFTSRALRLQIVSVPYELAQRTWFVEADGQTYVVCGPEYVGALKDTGGKVTLEAEATAQRGYSRPVFARPYDTTIFTPSGAREQLRMQDADARKYLTGLNVDDADAYNKAFGAPATLDWEERPADAEAAPGYYAGKWKFSINPPAMGADGDTSAYAWYRANLRSPKDGVCSLGFSDAGDWIKVYVNGEPAGAGTEKQRSDRAGPRTVNVQLKAGENTIAVLTAHYGRQKLVNYLGPIDTIDAKGLAGPVFLSRDAAGSVTVSSWRWRSAVAADARLAQAPAHTDTNTDIWRDAKIGEDVFEKRRGFAWYHAMLPRVPGPHRRLHFDGVDDNATVFVNGRRLFSHKGWDVPFEVNVDGAWRDSGPNELLVLVENMDNTGGIAGEVQLLTNSAQDGAPIQGWRERGGLDSPASDRGWKPMKDTRGIRTPTLYRTEFTYAPPSAPGAHPILRLVPLGLSRGFVWLNGHNLGRYPEKTRAPGLYLPECWLKQGGNKLIVFDEEGNSPEQAHLIVEAETSRLSYELGSTAAKDP